MDKWTSLISEVLYGILPSNRAVRRQLLKLNNKKHPKEDAMKKYFVCLIVVSLLMASSADADRRRPVRVGPSMESLSVEAVVSHIPFTYFWTDDETVYDFIVMKSARPLVLGTTFTASVQKPGESSPTFLTSSVVESHHVGGWKALTLYVGKDFYDQDSNGNRQYWLPGVAPFKVDVVTAGGVKTSVSTEVPVNMGDSRLPLYPLRQADVQSEGKVKLSGDFKTTPVVVFYQFSESGWRGAPVSVSPEYEFNIPDGWLEEESLYFVTGCSEYPNAKCSTVEVDIPVPQKGKQFSK